VRFDELVTEWTVSHLAHGLRPSSVKDYRQSLQRLSDYFGRREVKSIKAADLELCRNELVLKVQIERAAAFERILAAAKNKEKLTDADKALIARETEIRADIERGGIRATAKMVGTARTLWKFAVSRGYAPRNVGGDVKKPASPTVVQDGVIDQNILTPAEVEQLIAATVPEHRCAVRFLFMSGARFGELCGLMWTDMDWASSRVIVRRQRSAMNGELAAPKTPAGTRWIDLPADLIMELKAHRLRIPGEFMFPVDERNFRSRVWHPALRRAGLRSIRIHDARHTHASLLIGSGADIVAVSRRLGHTNPAITLSTYSHAFARRSTDGLGEQLATFMRQETVDCDLVASGKNAVVARNTGDKNVNEISYWWPGRELNPTRGFSVQGQKRTILLK
jgi:integrase